MNQSFSNSAETLLSFLSQPGRGFYIPYYQRNYSWDEDNAEQLVSDIFRGVRRSVTKANNTIFLGTVILHDETNVTVGIHADSPNLLTKVSNVVDGQQRIVSIGLLACAFSETLTIMVENLRSFSSSGPEFDTLAQELENELTELRELYSVEIRKHGAQPRLKPVIIRAGDVTLNPVSDQWTLAGSGASFYRSNTASFVSEFITGTLISDIPKDERIEGVMEVFRNRITSELNSADYNVAHDFLIASRASGGSLFNFIDYPPDLVAIQGFPDQEKSGLYAGIVLLAVCHFLKNACHFVVIECQDEGIAFDMFQALNATGTPLTAFEVFKPTIVRLYGASYPSMIKPQVDRIEAVFERESTAAGKEELTDKVIASSALVYNGSAISNKFSEERDWLVDTFPPQGDPLSIEFIRCIADQGEYRDYFIRPRRSPKNANSFTLVNKLQSLGMTTHDADLAAMCIFYLRDANHQFAHTVISVFYSKLLRAQGSTAAVASSSLEFLSICKSTAAFFTLWMGALQGRFPDSVYRKLFQSTTANISTRSGSLNQTASFVKDVFRKALEQENVYLEENPVISRTTWVSKAKNIPWYAKKSVCRFALFVGFHDAAPDLTPANEGLFTSGMRDSAQFLNCKAWHSSSYEVIEHVATRDRPSIIKFSSHFDETIYPGNNSIVDKLGNLTLLSLPVNSSVYSEWPEKVFYYWSLTQPQNMVAGPAASALMSSLGLTSLPPSLASLTASSNYLAHLAPLAYRGVSGKNWNSTFIENRSEHLCGRIYDVLDGWLR